MPTDLPPYPPSRVWSFPAPPVRRGWFWAAVAAMITSLVVGTGLVVVAVVGESTDAPGLIDDPELLSIIDSECATMTDRVRSVDRTDTIEAIREQNRAVISMVELIDVRAGALVDDDAPAAAWLDDWRDLVAARDAFVTTVDTFGQGRLEIPRTDDGELIVDRMDAATIDGSCVVPEVLVDPDAGGTQI